MELQAATYDRTPVVPRTPDGTTTMFARSVRRLREGRELPQGPLAELRAAITCQVWTLRRAGLPPERVLKRVKASLREAMDRDGWVDPAASREITERAVSWTIAAYFDR